MQKASKENFKLCLIQHKWPGYTGKILSVHIDTASALSNASKEEVYRTVYIARKIGIN